MIHRRGSGSNEGWGENSCQIKNGREMVIVEAGCWHINCCIMEFPIIKRNLVRPGDGTP